MDVSKLEEHMKGIAAFASEDIGSTLTTLSAMAALTASAGMALENYVIKLEVLEDRAALLELTSICRNHQIVLEKVLQENFEHIKYSDLKKEEEEDE